MKGKFSKVWDTVASIVAILFLVVPFLAPQTARASYPSAVASTDAFISVSAPEIAYVNQTYEIKVRIENGDTETLASVNMHLPSGVIAGPIESTRSGSFQIYDWEGDYIDRVLWSTWDSYANTYHPLEPGEVFTLTLKTTPKVTGEYMLKHELSLEDVVDPEPANNVAWLLTTVHAVETSFTAPVKAVYNQEYKVAAHLKNVGDTPLYTELDWTFPKGSVVQGYTTSHEGHSAIQERANGIEFGFFLYGNDELHVPGETITIEVTVSSAIPGVYEDLPLQVIYVESLEDPITAIPKIWSIEITEEIVAEEYKVFLPLCVR